MRAIYMALSLFSGLISNHLFANDLSFTMQNQEGKTVSAADYQGQHLLIAVGYTTCPDVCPTTLMEMTMVMNSLDSKAAGLKPIFVSVDPNRDTPEKLKQYVGFFHPSIDALVGNAAQTAAISANLGAAYGYQLNGLPLEGDYPARYEVFHSSYFYLYGPQGELVDVFGYGTPPSRIAASIAPYLAEPTEG